MLIDPITVAAHSPTPALSFAVVDAGALSSQRWDVPNGYKLNFNHSNNPKSVGEKHYMQLTQTVSAVDPISGGTSLQTASVSLSVSIPPFGWTSAAKIALVQALLDTLADSDVTITNFLNFQS
jgi:hypothetical protein